MRKIYIASLLFLACMACQKKDLQVTPVGGSLPYSGPNKTVSALLDSTNLTLFKAAWKRVNMDSVIKTTPYQAVTVLAPTDDAFAAAGITMNDINTLPVEDLDTLVFYHTLTSWLTQGALKTTLGNISMGSALIRTDFNGFYSNSPYTYYQYTGLKDGKLMVNGKPHTYSALDATNGTIYMIDSVLRKPDMYMIDYLANNPDFTFFMRSVEINDSLNQTVFNFDEFMTMLSTVNTFQSSFTVIAPTNNAFHAAGYNTLDDLLARATRAPMQYAGYDENYYYVNPTSPLDSQLMSLHLDFNVNAKPARPYLIFSNDMSDNPSLGGMLINPGSQYSNPPQYLRLSFSTSGSQILVSQIGSPIKAQPLATTDMLFMNGVIHVLDAGLVAP
jgi:uncharacterized surface protein with fasciclin (FAS1) repeats